MSDTLVPSYQQRLERRCRQVNSVLCAGIDPSPESLALLADSGSSISGQLERFSGMIVESVRDVAAAVKFQVAWFELHGADGMRALERSMQYARRAGLIVVADAKRGDVPHSARAYAQAWLSADSVFAADALTVNAAIGSDALDALMEIASVSRTQTYVLVHTSNPGAASLQGALLDSGKPWWITLAQMVESAGAGAVVGATHPHVFQQARSQMPTAPLLIPGIGAQGGSIDDLIPLATDDSAPVLVAVSRSLLPDHPCQTGEFREVISGRAADLATQTIPLISSRVRARGVISSA